MTENRKSIQNRQKQCKPYEIKESRFFIEKYNTLIYFYEHKLIQLKKRKPFFFQKTKLKLYNDQINDYEHSIMNLYRLIEQESNTNN